MIRELSVENIAIIDQASLHLHPGFTALTGETGAGKSLLIDAIDLALGGRADSDLVRAGASKGVVHLVADLTHNPLAKEQCALLGVELEDDLLFVQRDIKPEGRSTCRLNGKPVPVSTLKGIGNLLVDLHGQHDHQALLDHTTHGFYLDAWIGEPARVLLEQVADAFSDLERTRQELAASRLDHRDREHQIDLLKFQIGEIEDASPVPGELETTETDLKKLSHFEKLQDAVQSALKSLNEQEPCAVDQLGEALQALDGVLRFDENLESALDPLRQARVYLDEAVLALRTYADAVDSDPEKLEELAGRIDTLKRLRRKYGEDETAILEFLSRARIQLDQYENAESNAERLAERVAEAEARYRELATQLSALRREHAPKLAKFVESEVRLLAMERALVEVRQQAAAPSSNGIDAVEFLFSANAGEPVRPLAKIASGGEISRVMLALKVVLAGKAGVPTLIFDEIDTGLSGRAAAVVAKKLAQLAESYQVIVISHLPQIASRAQFHFRIHKAEIRGRVTTQLLPLEAEDRVLEIARMIAGESIGDMALANAREFLR